jgi:hypothetical protein
LRQSTLDPALAQRYEACQSALKWIGVTCFGYLGYHNARFGRIESHEAVTAFGREKLLRAKEIAEAHGYELLHALSDAVWVQHPDVSNEALAALCAEITRATGVTMALEGRYRWVAFLPSKVRADLPVATRYFGVFADGTWKARGLAYRRHNVPVFVQRTQLAMLGALAEAADLAGVPAADRRRGRDDPAQQPRRHRRPRPAGRARQAGQRAHQCELPRRGHRDPPRRAPCGYWGMAVAVLCVGALLLALWGVQWCWFPRRTHQAVPSFAFIARFREATRSPGLWYVLAANVCY